MKTLYLDLRFRSPKKGDLPGPSIAQVCVKGHGTEDDTIILGAQCVTYEELEEQVEYLKKELDAVRKKAKTKFAGKR